LNLQIVGIDTERDLLLLRGAVPGANGSLILVREAVKA
jgi:large subunit ribosomal protein L3